MDKKVIVIDDFKDERQYKLVFEKWCRKENKHILYVSEVEEEIEVMFKQSKSFGVNLIRPRDLGSISNAISEEKNIITHINLFEQYCKELESAKINKVDGYTLILDRSLELLSCLKLTGSKMRNIFLKGYTTTLTDNRLKRNGKNTKGEHYKVLLYMIENRLCYRGENVDFVFFNPKYFEKFEEIYLFNLGFLGSLQKVYFDIMNFKYKLMMYEEKGYKLKCLNTQEYIKNLSKKRSLISVFDEDKYIYPHKTKYKEHLVEGDFGITLSSTWFTSKSTNEELLQLKNNLVNYFNYKIKSKSSENMWTCLKEFEEVLGGGGYKRGFTLLNCISLTDKTKKKQTLAYTYNFNLSPYFIRELNKNKTIIDENLYIFFHLLNWCNLSKLSENKPINLYIMSRSLKGKFGLGLLLAKSIYSEYEKELDKSNEI